MKLTLKELRTRVQDEHDAYLLMEELRWGKDRAGIVCPHCANTKAYFLNPKGGSRGTGRKDENGERTRSVRRVWKCASCRKQFSVLTGTIFHGTKVSISDWLTVMVLMTSAKNGISAREVERLCGVTPETAWYMLHRLREAMKREPLVGMLSGVVVADETFIGGKPKNRHQQGRPSRLPGGGRGRSGSATQKTPVLSLVSRETGEVRSVVIPDVTGKTLRKAMQEHLDVPNTILHTDASGPYKMIANEFAGHEYVDHSSYEYVRGDVTSNHAEGFFSQLKRSLDGTHHHVSREHLHRYLAEFDFRYTTRKLTDPERLQMIVDRTFGRRLSYKPLTGR